MTLPADGYIENQGRTVGEMRAALESLRDEIANFTRKNVASYGTVNDGVTPTTTALQSALDDLNDNDEMYLPEGTYLVEDTLTISNLERFRLYGPGIIKPGSGVDAKPVLKITNCRDSLLEDFDILGNDSFPPSSAINFHRASSGGHAPTHMKLSNIRLGSPEADSLVDGIAFTSDTDANNAEVEYYGVKIITTSGAALNVGHSNSLIHRIFGGDWRGGNQCIRLAGGNVTAFGLWMTGTWLVEQITGTTQAHKTELIGCHAEGTYKLLKCAQDNAIFSFTDCHFKGGTDSVDNIELTSNNNKLSFVNTHLLAGGTARVIDLGTGTDTDAEFIGCQLGANTIQWGGRLALVGCTHEPSSVTLTPGASAELVEVGNKGGESGSATKGLRLGIGGTLGGPFQGTFYGTRLSVAASDYSANPIAANTAATFTVTVTGVATGTPHQAVMVSPSASPGAGLSWSAYVSGTDTVTVVVANCTTGNVTPSTVHWWVAAVRVP